MTPQCDSTESEIEEEFLREKLCENCGTLIITFYDYLYYGGKVIRKGYSCKCGRMHAKN